MRKTLAVLAGVLATTLSVVAPVTATASTPNVRDACPAASAGQVRCFAKIRTDVHSGRGVRAAADLPAGYGPADLRSAYNLPSTGGSNSTVAIVDAGDDGNAESDLAVYRQTYGLPACTTANGCFQKVNQEGKPSPLPVDQGWDVEIALDLDMVSAACPGCKILLVESDDPTYANMAAAENTAATLGATEISNSYGGTESGANIPYASSYAHPGVAVVASSGDYGYAAPNFPAVLGSVIAVGGTSLTKASNARGWSETVWNSDGGAAASGCSAWVDKPSWQHDANCPGRMVADVAADADPQTGPAIYITEYGYPGWTIVGGTSAASPFVAGVIGLAGNPQQYPDASYFYAHASELNDVTSGNNVVAGGQDCGGDYQCNGETGYDGPTGLGTPNGTAAF